MAACIASDLSNGLALELPQAKIELADRRGHGIGKPKEYNPKIDGFRNEVSVVNSQPLSTSRIVDEGLRHGTSGKRRSGKLWSTQFSKELDELRRAEGPWTISRL